MSTVLLVIHVILAVALILVVLLQKNAQDGGGLLGGSGTMGGLFTARGTANVLTRATAILATGFICTSLALAFLAARDHNSRQPLDDITLPAPAATTETGPAGGEPAGVMPGGSAPAIPRSGTPSAPAVPMGQ